MKNLNCLEKYRWHEAEHCRCGCDGDEGNGIFRVYVGNHEFLVVASNGGGWEHVSVSPMRGKSCPTWDEMCAIKDMFFEPEEAVVEYHPRKSDYVNNCPNCLHMWRPLEAAMPTPPPLFVGVKG